MMRRWFEWRKRIWEARRAGWVAKINRLTNNNDARASDWRELANCDKKVAYLDERLKTPAAPLPEAKARKAKTEAA